MKPVVRIGLAVVVVAVLGALGAVLPRTAADSIHARISAAATNFVQSFPEQERSKFAFSFEADARADWHFVPRSRPGVRMADMTDAQRHAARDLLRSTLSSQGVHKVEQIMSLDTILREIENNPGRDPLQYTFAIYGDPGSKSPWGWKVEGHHLSLNFTFVDGHPVATTPSFLGANPATIQSGPRAGTRAMAVEEDLARELLRSLDDAQRAEAVIAEKAPSDILLIPGRPFDAAPAAGLPYSRMTAEQRRMLEELLDEYAHNLRRELADAELSRIRAAGLDALRFAWAGSFEPGHGHYYRITGPTFVIEYDNTQNNANHVHTIWHDRDRNFGRDALREHYQRDHGSK